VVDLAGVGVTAADAVDSEGEVEVVGEDAVDLGSVILVHQTKFSRWEHSSTPLKTRCSAPRSCPTKYLILTLLSIFKTNLLSEKSMRSSDPSMKFTFPLKWMQEWSQAVSKREIRYISEETNYSPSRDFYQNPKCLVELQSGVVEAHEVVDVVVPLAGEAHEGELAAGLVVDSVAEVVDGAAALGPLAAAQEDLVVETEADADAVDSAGEAEVEDVVGARFKKPHENDACFSECTNVICVYSGVVTYSV